MNSLENLQFHIISMATYGVGLSGGDRIFIELARRLGEKYPVYLYLWEEGLHICKREGLEDVNYVMWSAKSWAEFGFFINYFARIFIGIFKALFIKIDNSPSVIIYSASEFWQDTIPAFIIKLRYPKVRWLAAWYQTAPNPFRGYSEGEEKVRYRFKAFLYWFVQLPIKPIIKSFASLVLVNNDQERKNFPELNKENKILVMLGAVDLKSINIYKNKFKDLPKIYDGVFQDRFHPQKGVVELIDIWKLIVKAKPDAKLAMIGDGPLMEKVKAKIEGEKLGSNVNLFGYLFDGSEKYKIFAQSKIVLHPSFYDSGGMASAEAMIFGLPAVGFNLPSYSSYYPEGMIKVKVGDLDAFAKQILVLLNEKGSYNKLAKEGVEMIESNWSWDQRVCSLLNRIVL